MVLKDKISYFEEELTHYQKRTNRKLEIENKLSKTIEELKSELSALKKEYFVISSRGDDEEVKYFGSDLEAAREAGRIEWNHLTPAEQKKCSVVIGCGEVEVDEYGDKYYDGYDVVHEFKTQD